jgi:hypothetical protein
MAGSGDQEEVKAFAAQCADEACGDRVRPRRADRGADDADVGAGEYRVECGSELGVGLSARAGAYCAHGRRECSPREGGRKGALDVVVGGQAA